MVVAVSQVVVAVAARHLQGTNWQLGALTGAGSELPLALRQVLGEFRLHAAKAACSSSFQLLLLENMLLLLMSNEAYGLEQFNTALFLSAACEKGLCP